MRVLKPENRKINAKLINEFRKFTTGVMHDTSLKALATKKLDCIFVPTKVAMFMWKKCDGSYRSEVESWAPLFSLRASAISKNERSVLLLLKSNIEKNKHKFYWYDTACKVQGKKEIYFDFKNQEQNYIQAFEFSHDDRFIYIGGMRKIWKCAVDTMTNSKRKVLSDLPIFTTVHNKIITIKVKQNYMGVGQGSGHLSIFSHQKLIYHSQHLHGKDIRYLAWANSADSLAFVSGDSVFIVSKNDSKWQERRLQYNAPNRIIDIAFSPQDRYLSIVTEDDFIIYDRENDFFVPSIVGYYKSMGASLTKDWQYMVCASLEEVALFDLKKQSFSYYPEYFEKQIDLERFLRKLRK